jgi:hypothetical protein
MPNLRVIHTEKDREEVIAWLATCKLGTRVEVRGPRRTLPQNDKMWAMLTDIARQRKTIDNREFTPEQWKSIFMEALGHEQDILPKLNNDGFFTVDTSTSKLSEAEMSDLIEFMFSWGAEVGVEWSDPNLRSQEAMRR